MDRSDAPDTVQRYLVRALGAHQRTIARVRLRQQGELRAGVAQARWLSFSAREIVDGMRIGFQWDARVRLLPLIHLHVRDAYRDGAGAAGVRVLSVVPVAAERDNAQLNAAALLRFLAEAPWYPSALVPSNKLRWVAKDERCAIATLADHGNLATLEFRFDASGDVAGVYTDARPRRTASGYEMTPWEGRFLDYAERDGLRVPLRGEVGWYVDGAWACVWRGQLLSTQYEFAE